MALTEAEILHRLKAAGAPKAPSNATSGLRGSEPAYIRRVFRIGMRAVQCM